MILANLNACHRDPLYWKQPDKFEPEHFLDESGNYITGKEGFIPFGIGMTPYQIVIHVYGNE